MAIANSVEIRSMRSGTESGGAQVNGFQDAGEVHSYDSIKKGAVYTAPFPILMLEQPGRLVDLLEHVTDAASGKNQIRIG